MDVQKISDIDWLFSELSNKKNGNRLVDSKNAIEWICGKCNKKWKESPSIRLIRETKHCRECNGFGNKKVGICIYENCASKGNFGIKLPLYCSKHADEDMVDLKNVRCLQCNRMPSFGIEKRTHCREHATPNMFDLAHPRCIYEGCGVRIESSQYSFCTKHGGKSCGTKKCNESNCTKSALYGIPGERPTKCLEHKEEVMINTHSKRCISKGCNKFPAFNYPDKKSPAYCKEHSLEGMVDVISKPCNYPGCETRPTYGYSENRKKISCKSHAEPGMILIVCYKCQESVCNANSTYGFPDDKRPTRCSKHILEGMINIISKTCEYPGCLIQPIFNLPGMKGGKFCLTHKSNEHVDVINKICIEPLCDNRSSYGIIGGNQTHCATHRTQNMIRKPSKKCEIKDCQMIATHGKRIEHLSDNHNHSSKCYYHAEIDDIYIYAKECVKCGLKQLLDKDEICNTCNPENELKHLHRKELQIKDYLIEHGITKFAHDKRIDKGVCGKERPDFVFDCGTHFVVLDLDEFQHKRGKYECENVRMFNISQSLALPTVFIRYNPDNYSTVEGGKRTPGANFGVRAEYLVKWIQYLTTIQLPCYLSVVYLFYDGNINNQLYKLA